MQKEIKMEEYVINKYKEKVLEVFKYTHRFCEENNLRYFTAYGSAIGCVRHKGFIPWDDDIDIYMPREDYNKLLTLKEKISKDGYTLKSIEDKPYYLPFAKIWDSNTTLLPFDNAPDVIGCFVDIFPIDLTNMDYDTYCKKYKQFRKLRFDYQSKIFTISISTIYKDLKNKQYGSLARAVLKIKNVFKNSDKILSNFLALQNSLNEHNGKKYISITESKPRMFEKEWFDDYVMMPFEDTMIRMPICYHQYLTCVYGDYMTPPPAKDRHYSFAHGMYYLNLQESLTLKQVKERIKQSEHFKI